MAARVVVAVKNEPGALRTGFERFTTSWKRRTNPDLGCRGPLGPSAQRVLSALRRDALVTVGVAASWEGLWMPSRVGSQGSARVSLDWHLGTQPIDLEPVR